MWSGHDSTQDQADHDPTQGQPSLRDSLAEEELETSQHLIITTPPVLDLHLKHRNPWEIKNFLRDWCGCDLSPFQDLFFKPKVCVNQYSAKFWRVEHLSTNWPHMGFYFQQLTSSSSAMWSAPWQAVVSSLSGCRILPSWCTQHCVSTATTPSFLQCCFHIHCFCLNIHSWSHDSHCWLSFSSTIKPW